MPRTRPSTDPALANGLHDDLHWLFARVKQGLAVAATPALRKYGLSHWGYTVLVAVANSPATSQLALAQIVSVDKSKLVLVIDELETAGFVRRRPDPADRRARRIEATDAGRQMLHSARREIDAIEGELLADLPSSARADLRMTLRLLVGDPVTRVEAGWPSDNACAPSPP